MQHSSSSSSGICFKLFHKSSTRPVGMQHTFIYSLWRQPSISQLTAKSCFHFSLGQQHFSPHPFLATFATAAICEFLSISTFGQLSAAATLQWIFSSRASRSPIKTKLQPHLEFPLYIFLSLSLSISFSFPFNCMKTLTNTQLSKQKHKHLFIQQYVT